MTTKNHHGPWNTFRMYTGQLYVTDKRGLGVCEVKDQFFQGKFRGDREANARLIAAAPELLEALEWMLAAHYNPDHAASVGVAERAKKALLAARGE